MRIDHLALWVKDLESMRDFYVKYFDGSSGEKYVNEKTGFVSYFIKFGKTDARIELMTRPDILPLQAPRGLTMGLAHFAISLGAKDKVNALTEELRKDHFTIFSEPRTTGDGYYESVVLDPEGNLVEITAYSVS